MAGRTDSITGTTSPDFQIGRRGPRIFSGTADPSVTSPGGPAEINGDLYIRTLTGSETLWQFAGGVWVDISSAASGFVFSGFHDTAITNLSESYVDLNIDVENLKAGFTHAPNSAIVTANFTGVISITAHVEFFSPSGAIRVTGLVKLQRDTGAGFVDVLGTEITTYVRQRPQDGNSRSSACISVVTLIVISGHDYKLQVKKDDGTGDNGVLDTVANSCQFTMSGAGS